MSKRRLAAIMFTDIAGYDSLLKRDEIKAFEVLGKNQRIHKRLINKFKGRRLKEMGGDILASFNSIVDAVMCAVYIQKATGESDIPVRIGIHLGEVIFEKNDVLGDGVNIASRIQGVAEKNEIVISETVYNDIRNKEGLEAEFIGERELKGVSKPLGIYKVSSEKEGSLDFTIDTGELIKPFSIRRTTIVAGIMLIALVAFSIFYFLSKLTKSPLNQGRSVLILPFDNYTGSDTLEYFTAGMHNAIIGEIGKIGALQVKSRTTANAYKNVDKSIPEIASELGVNVVVEGSVLCVGDSICLEVRMVDTKNEEKLLWINNYKVERSQIQNLYSIVTKDFSERINTSLTPQEERLINETRLVDPAAHDLYMKGMVYNDQMSEDGLERAEQYFKLANEKDPDWAAPYRGMASVLERQYQMGFVERSIAMPKLSEYIDKAIKLDPNSSWVYNLRGSKAAWFEWNWKQGEQDFLKSIELNPSHAGNHAFYAGLLTLLRRTDEALNHAKIAQELAPLDPFILGLCAGVHIEAGECDIAIRLIDKAISIEPNHFFTYPRLIHASICIGDFQRAFEVMKEINYNLWEKFEGTEHFENIFHDHGWIAVQEEIIKLYEEKGPKNNLREERQQAIRLIMVKKYDRALDYLEKAYDRHSPNLPSISNNSTYNKLKDNPRYLDLLKKMNLPAE
jgi:class 3 adenylate cyclase/TolB-like protein